MHFKYLHLNFSHFPILLSLFLYRYTHHQSTTSLLYSNTALPPRSLATVTTLSPHPFTVSSYSLSSLTQPPPNIPSPTMTQLFGQLSLRAKEALPKSNGDGSNSWRSYHWRAWNHASSTPFHQNMRITTIIIYFSQLKDFFLLFIFAIIFFEEKRFLYTLQRVWKFVKGIVPREVFMLNSNYLKVA